MKRVVTAAFALSLAASTSALAQPHGRPDHGGRDRGPPAPQAQAQPQAQPQSQPQAPRQFRGPRGGDPGRQRGPETARADRPEGQARPQGGWDGQRGARPGGERFGGQARPQAATPQAAPAAPQVRRNELPGGPAGEAIRGLQQRQREQGRLEGRGDGRYDGRRDGDRGDGRYEGRRDGDRSDGRRDGGRGWDRGPAQRPDWARPDGRRDRDRSRPRYDAGRYQREWRPSHRYRVPYYRAPVGYYAYRWSFNDYLPWGWYSPSYWIDDWFAYGLPMPPAGCEWVRVGEDALLIDIFDGRVLSVVRMLFW